MTREGEGGREGEREGRRAVGREGGKEGRRENYLKRLETSLPSLSRVTELDAIQEEHTLRVGQNESIEGQDFEHLESRDQRAAALLDHMTNCMRGDEG